MTRVAIPPLPALAALRERALELAGLSMSRSKALRRGLAERGLWPSLSLRFDADIDRDQAWDSDQAFVSGETRQLYDRARDRSTGYGASVELEWELGNVVFPEDTVDLSREQRQVISLRDDISDEINQIYFARRSIEDRLVEGNGIQGIGDLDPQGCVVVWENSMRDSMLGPEGWLSRWRVDQGADADPP